MLSIKIYHVCGKNSSLKKFNEGGKTLAWVIYCEMRGSVGFLPGWPCTLLKAVSDRHQGAAASQRGAQRLTAALGLPGGKSRTLAVTGYWNLSVLSPFPLRQQHLKQNPKLRCLFSLAILSYTRPDWLEVLVQFKMLFVHLDTLFSHVLLSRSSVTIRSKTSYTEFPTAHTPLGLTRCL